MKRKVLCVAGVWFMTLTATNVRAYTCTTTTPSTVLTPNSVTVPRDLAVGSLIGNELISGSVETFLCSDTPAPSISKEEFGVKAYGTYVGTYNGRRVYSTNVPGVGYAVGATSINVCRGKQKYVDGTDTIDGNADNKKMCTGINNFLSNASISAQANIQFYKTSQTVGTGTVNARQVGAFILHLNQKSWMNPESAISIAAFNVTSIACTVSNVAISVPMGAVEKRMFAGLGTWPGDSNTRSFSILLNCNAGIKVNIQIDGNAKDAAQGVLNLDSGNDSASGVGVQLLHDNAPMPLATPINTGTATSDGVYSIPLQARYYQIGSNITPGNANASATFTLTYP